MEKSLIANSGIQFIKFENVEINPNNDVAKRLRFHEWYDPDAFRKYIGYAYKINMHDILVDENNLKREGFLTDGKLDEDNLNVNLLPELTEGEDAFSVHDITSALDLYKDEWLPLPFFETNNGIIQGINPTNWCRIKFLHKNTVKSVSTYDVVLAFDTKSIYDEEQFETPYFFGNERAKVFELCKDKQMILNYCSDDNSNWVDEYLIKLVHNGELPEAFPTYKYLANYIFLVYYLGCLDILPSIKLFADKDVEKIDTDLVLDVGNSRTCGLIFDSSAKGKPFTQVSKLKLQDLSIPNQRHDEPFAMRLAFHKANFGEIGYNNKQFVWPSILRLGKEADRLIYLSTNRDIEGENKVTNHSSPKRYLWDDAPTNVQWEYVRLEGDFPIKSIYFEGISEQFNSDGSFNPTSDFGAKSVYSRKSLMTFVYLEILAHAYSQINSYDFRSNYGNINKPRRIKRVLITCPTAMPIQERIVLRQCAEEASIVLKRFYEDTYNEDFDMKNYVDKIEVIPPVKDLKSNMGDVQDLKDWGYDEATSVQLVFLYAEIAQRYIGKGKEYFNLYGKHRKGLGSDKTLTIASIDIGAGTTDLMICAYQCSESGKTILTPTPLYGESFYYAGDDLLKEIIHQVLLEGMDSNTSENNRGGSVLEKAYVGIIKYYLEENNVSNIEEKLAGFFGEDSNLMNYTVKRLRRDFNIQILVPIALKYIELTQKEAEKQTLSFEDFFPIHKPSAELLEHFRATFGVPFEDIKWNFNKENVNRVVISCFDDLLKQISSIIYAYGADFVLLAGKPMSLNVFRDLFLKYYPVPPDRLITLNDYRVGKWYPFHDGNGYFEDQKSIVAVGAMIGLMGGRLDMLNGFMFNMDVMKKEMLSTAKYMGLYNVTTKQVEESFLTPNENKSNIRVYGLPISLGCKQLDSNIYLARPLYELDFNDKAIIEKIQKRQSITDANLINDELNRYKENIKRNMPLTFKIYRDYRSNRENIYIESILDKDREELSPLFFRIGLRTLPENKVYWLDTGEFTLSIRTK